MYKVVYKGVTYKNLKACAIAYGLSYTTLRSRLNSGLTMEEALTKPLHGIVACDHKGRTYPTMRAMAEAYGLSYMTLRSRLNSGLTMEEALTMPLHGIVACDHKGRTYPSMSAMARAYGLSYITLRTRLYSGLTMEEALTKPLRASHGAHKCIDHLGQEFSSIKAMCKHWNVLYESFFYRINQGMSVEKALTEVRKPRRKRIKS